MNTKNTISIMALVLTIGLLTACTLAEEKLENTISEAHKIAESVQVNPAIAAIEHAKKDGQHKEVSVSYPVEAATVLRVDHEVGNIEVIASSDDKINVSATIWSLNSSNSKKKYNEIMNNASVSVVAHGDQLEVHIHPNHNSKLNLWKWAKKEYGVSDLSIDYRIELPKSVNRFELTSSVGNIKLINLEGNYQVVNNVGSIQVENAQLMGKSNIQSEAGSLHLGIQAMEVNSRLLAKTEVGSIHSNIPETLQVSLETNTEVGRVTGASKGKSELNGGGPALILSTNVGSITVDHSK